MKEVRLMQQHAFDFSRDVIEASFQQPIIVDFWAPWCAPCRILGPVLEKLAAEANGHWRLVKVNTEEFPRVAAEYRVHNIPAVKMFADGKVIADFLGALPEHSVLRWLKQHLPTESKKATEEAVRLMESGDVDKAKRILRYAIEQEDSNTDARIMLANLIFDEQPEEAMDLVKDVDEAHTRYDIVDALRTLYRLQHEDFQGGETTGKAWEAYRAGIAAFRAGNYGTALEQWIDAILYDRTIDDDGPRRACIALFKRLGPEHELTQKYHRQFTSALF